MLGLTHGLRYFELRGLLDIDLMILVWNCGLAKL